MDTFLESYRIDSPEHVEVELSLAGLGSRTVAYILDTLIRIGIGLIFLILFSLAGIADSLRNASELMIVLLVIILFLLQWAYFVVFEMAMKGQTPGKRIMKIRVVRDGGYPLSFLSSAIRNLLRVVDFLPAFYGLGVFLIFVSRRKKRLGDTLAGTIVIHQQQTRLRVPTSSAAAELPASLKRFPLLRLNEEEKQVIRAYLERSSSLDWKDRVRVREKIYRKMAEKIRSVYPDYQEEAPHLRDATLQELIHEE
jgi:uncharacterized RDD family membrane protein YckC